MASVDRCNGLLTSRSTRDTAGAGVGPGVGEPAAHATGRGGRVVQAGDDDEGHHPGQPAAVRVAHRQRVGVGQPDLGRRHRAGAELVLEPVQPDTGGGRVGGGGETGQRGISRVPGDEERCQAFATGDGVGGPRAIAMAESMAEQNHFSPWIRHDPSAAGRPVVWARPTSEPPCDSVIHCPLVIATAGSVDSSRGSQASRTASSTSDRDSSAAARRPWPPGR